MQGVRNEPNEVISLPAGAIWPCLSELQEKEPP